MPVFTHESLRLFARTLFMKGGSEAPEANTVADHLVDANLKGHDSHGIGMVPHYVSNLHNKTVIPNTAAELMTDSGPMLIVDGGRGYGQRVAHETMDFAIDRTRQHGVAVVGLRNAHHIGRVGAYGERCADAGLVSLHFVNVVDHGPRVAPHGGRDSRLNTNPVCLAMPATPSNPATVLDMATSKVALGKVRVAWHAEREVPEDMILDEHGEPTTDPGVMYREPQGALLPMGDHKGFGLSLFCELFAGVLTGYGTIQPGTERQGGIINCMFTLCVDPDRLVDRHFLHQEVDDLIAYLTASPARDVKNPVQVPGDPERRAWRERAEDGVRLSNEAWRDIVAAAKTLNVDANTLVEAA